MLIARATVTLAAVMRCLTSARRAVRGVAAVEFAVTAPLGLLFVIGVFDISKAMTLYEEVYNTAHTIPVSASVLAVQPDKSTSLTVTQVQQSLSAIFAEIPLIRAGIETGTKSVTMTSVVFLQTDANCVPSSTVTCSYAPWTTWSVPYSDPPGRYPNDVNTFQAVVRACTQLTQTTPVAYVPSDLTELPTTDVVNPDPILVVDVHYRYTPLFFNFITGPVDFWASGFYPVRSVAMGTTPSQQYTHYDIANQGNGAYKCAGFS